MSTAKSTTQDLLDEGFRPEQFGSPATWAGTYLGDLVAEAGRWVEAQLGAAVYGGVSSDTYAFDCCVKAEVQYASMVLWRRRAKFMDGAAQVGLEGTAYLDRREMLAHAEDARQNAVYWLGEAARALGVDPPAISAGGGISVGYTETGRFPQTSPGPLNA